jgi:hypothetical protein
VRQEGLGQFKKIHLIGTRTRDLPACSIVPQPTTLPRAPATNINIWYSLLEERLPFSMFIFFQKSEEVQCVATRPCRCPCGETETNHHEHATGFSKFTSHQQKVNAGTAEIKNQYIEFEVLTE